MRGKVESKVAGARRRRSRGSLTGTPRGRELLDRAAQLFYQRGFDATTMQDIADAMGVLKGSLYHYIDNKEDILLAIIEQTHGRALEVVERCRRSEGDALDRLRELVLGVLEVNEADHIKVAVFVHEFRALDGERRTRVVSARTLIERYLLDLLEEGQNAGLVRGDLDIRLAAMGILGMLNWTYEWYRPGGALTAGEIADAFTRLAIGGLAPRPMSEDGQAERCIGSASGNGLRR
jgi:AcrR family transcriptional regulator